MGSVEVVSVSTAKDLALQRLADLRYVGQGHQIVVPLPDGRLGPQHEAEIADNFDQIYQRLYGRSLPGVPIEGITWRLTALGAPTAMPYGIVEQRSGANGATHSAPRSIYLPELGDFAQVPVYNRYALSPHSTFNGPAVIEERESTVVIGTQSCAEIDAFGNLSVSLRGDA